MAIGKWGRQKIFAVTGLNATEVFQEAVRFFAKIDE